MSRLADRPTLLVFTLGAAADRERRPLLPGRLRGAELGLRRAVLDDVLAAGREAGLELALCAPRPLAEAPDVTWLRQGEGRFGARFAAAFESAGGGAPVVAVGGDSPGLGARHLRCALAALAGDPDCVVAGPCPDGGFYLLAAARPLPGLADGVAWCRRDALASLARLAAGAGRRLVLLAPLADLDRPADLHRWLARSGALPEALRRVAREIARMLGALRRPAAPRRLGRALAAAMASPDVRGPPLPLSP